MKSYLTMPENAQDNETKAKLYSIYMRPWTLLHQLADLHVPHLESLDLLTRPEYLRLRCKQSEAAAGRRGWLESWRYYIQGGWR